MNSLHFSLTPLIQNIQIPEFLKFEIFATLRQQN